VVTGTDIMPGGGFELFRSVALKNLFDAQSEEPGGAEGQGQTRIEFTGLGGVDRLAGHLERIGQVGLCSTAFRAQQLQEVLHQ
jgi:hypothetical protein